MREFLEPAVEAVPELSIFGKVNLAVPIQAHQNTWEVVESPNRLLKDFSFSSYDQLQSFLLELMQYQEEVNHHSKITVDHRNIRVESYTHDVEDVTELDKELANMADMIYRDVQDYGCGH